VHAALAAKDASALACAHARFPRFARATACVRWCQLYGDASRCSDEAAKRAASGTPGRARGARPDCSGLPTASRAIRRGTVSYDLADLRGYAYYSGMRFGIYAPGAADALVRGGRYDEVGAVFGRNRPAVGFSSRRASELVGVAAGTRPLQAPPSARPGATQDRPAPGHRRGCARPARPWSACCRATAAKSMNSIATASSSSKQGSGKSEPSEFLK
jgi:ATP phosphoribosyltransferase regulatory subunit